MKSHLVKVIYNTISKTLHVFDLLNKARVGKINDDVEKLLKARFIYESDENYPEYVLQMMSSDVLPSRKY